MTDIATPKTGVGDYLGISGINYLIICQGTSFGGRQPPQSDTFDWRKENLSNVNP
jgi:hypothetical protein